MSCSSNSSSSDESYCKKKSKKIKYVVLNGPRGCTGPIGPSNGITGPTGPTGEQGPPGTNGERGSHIFTSQENPPTTNNGTYINSDIWINVSNGLYWVFNGYVWQQLGSLAGVRGSRITSSPNNPEPGNPPSPHRGDIHINTTTFDYFSYSADTCKWVKLGNIQGPTGPTGPTGIGPTGPTGKQGPPGTIKAYGMISRAGDNSTSIHVSGSDWKLITASTVLDNSNALLVEQSPDGAIKYTGETPATFTISGAVTLQGYNTIDQGNIFTWFKNGTEEVNSNYRVYQSTATEDSRIPASIAGMVTLCKDDYIQLAVRNNNGFITPIFRDLRGYYIQIHSVN